MTFLGMPTAPRGVGHIRGEHPVPQEARRALAMVESSQSLDRLDANPRERSGIDLIRQLSDALADDCAEGRVVIVETTGIGDGIAVRSGRNRRERRICARPPRKGVADRILMDDERGVGEQRFEVRAGP